MANFSQILYSPHGWPIRLLLHCNHREDMWETPLKKSSLRHAHKCLLKAVMHFDSSPVPPPELWSHLFSTRNTTSFTPLPDHKAKTYVERFKCMHLTAVCSRCWRQSPSKVASPPILCAGGSSPPFFWSQFEIKGSWKHSASCPSPQLLVAPLKKKTLAITIWYEGLDFSKQFSIIYLLHISFQFLFKPTIIMDLLFHNLYCGLVQLILSVWNVTDDKTFICSRTSCFLVLGKESTQRVVMNTYKLPWQ